MSRNREILFLYFKIQGVTKPVNLQFETYCPDMKPNIRPATPADLDRLMEIFEAARRFMVSTGNPNQWINGYPQRGLIAEEISKERTASPWIYNELSLADMIEIRPINCYRDKFLQFSHRAYDAVNESSSLQIKYEVDKMLRNFISLSKYDLISCAKEWRANNKSFQSALDYIYLSKNIIKQRDILIG